MLTYEQLVAENERLRQLISQYESLVLALRETVAQQQEQIVELKQEIERLRRGGKRQAAPFSKGPPKAKPRKPGRKKGIHYGRVHEPEVPKRIDRTIQVGCPVYCPHCEAAVRLEGKASQYQIDLPPIRPQTTQFVVHYGRCEQCGRRVQGRHQQQVSDALSVGKVHFGPSVVALTAHLSKVCGLSYGKIAALLGSWMGLPVNRSSLCRALGRLRTKAAPTYEALVEKVRGSPVVAGDETGWKVAGLRSWLWGFTTGRETVYRIERGRGFAEASKVLGAEFAGVLVVDGWAPYRSFKEATLQTCLTHLLRRCSDLLEEATRGAVRFPRQVREILEKALEVRDRREAGEITSKGVQIVRGRLQARMSRLLSGRFSNADNLRLAKHLRRYEAALFVFLTQEGVEATNWQAEHAMRAAVMTRKCCGGGNRSETGAETQAVLMSLLRTCHQKSLAPVQVITEILRNSRSQPNTQLVYG